MDTIFALKFFGALFAIMNPFSGLPIFLSLTEGMTPGQQRAIAVKVASYIAVMGLVVALAGNKVLHFFGISIHDLQVAGGLVVLGIAFSMLNGGDSSAHHGTAKEKAEVAETASAGDSIAFYPLTFPLMMGPGAITTLILFSSQVQHPRNWIGYFIAFGAAVLAIAVVFALGSKLGRHLTSTARVIMTRVMGLILASIAVQMIVEGLATLLPGLGAAAGAG